MNRSHKITATLALCLLAFVAVPGAGATDLFDSHGPLPVYRPYGLCWRQVLLYHAPAGVEPVVQSALDRLGEATGIRWQVLGTTSLGPSGSWPTWGAGHFPTPPTVAWMTDAEAHAANPNFPSLTQYSGFAWSAVDAGQRVTGFAVLSIGNTSGWPPVQLESLVMHEMGHVLGLGDLGMDGTEMMGWRWDATWGASDSAALDTVGRLSGCRG